MYKKRRKKSYAWKNWQPQRNTSSKEQRLLVNPISSQKTGNKNKLEIKMKHIKLFEAFLLEENAEDLKAFQRQLMSIVGFAQGYKVAVRDVDFEELGYQMSDDEDKNRQIFKEYFNIPAEADEDPTYKRDKNYDVKTVASEMAKTLKSAEKNI